MIDHVIGKDSLMKKIIAHILIAVMMLAMLMPAAAFATNDGTEATEVTPAPADPTPAPADPTPAPADPTPAPADPTPAPADPTPSQPATSPEQTQKPALSVKVSPAELTEEGTVSLTVTVQNPNTTDITNASVSVDGKKVKDIGTIAGGSKYEYSGKYTVETAKLGKALKVTVSYDGGSVSESFTVKQKDAKINVNTIGKVDKTAVEAGGEVNFSFSIENKSNVAIENASLSASTLNNGERLGKKFSLAADGDATIILYTATITQTIDVAPILTFQAAGTTYTKKFDPMTITVNDAKMDIVATPATTTPEEDAPVEFAIAVTNTGNVNFTEVALYDANDQRVTTSSNQLMAGGAISATHSMTFAESGSFDFYVVATDEAGTTYSFRSNVIDIQLAEAEVSDYSQYFTLTVSVPEDSAHLSEPGKATVELTLKNTYTEAFRDVKIVEKNSGEVVETYSSFPVGEKVLTYEREIESTTGFEFVLTATDPDGNIMTVNAERVSVSVEEEKKSSGSKLTTLLVILGVIFVLIIGCGVVLIVMVVKEKKKKAEEQPEEAEEGRRTRISRVNRPAAEAALAEEGEEEAAAPAEEPEPEVKIYSRRPAPRRSYEDLVAEPAVAAAPAEKAEPEEAPAEPVILPVAEPEEDLPEVQTPEAEYLEEEAAEAEVPAAEPELPAEEAPAEEPDFMEPLVAPVPRRKRREFEDRNIF